MFFTGEVELCSANCVCSVVVNTHYRSFNHNRAIDAAMSVLRAANSFIQTHQPWLLAKSSDGDDRATLDCVLHVGLESSRVATLALSPVIPDLSRRILDRLGCQSSERLGRHMTQSLAGSRRLGADRGPLFTRIKPPSIADSVTVEST